ncbi:MAG: RsmB/NOP family class I SAM-dependent RNA methyltransferase [Thermoproteales archaeon]|nr:RsmB/NOP family class I SAM-dependent RNA methyltransferase [Thermoproteales archaeon]
MKQLYYVEYVLADVLTLVEQRKISLRGAMSKYFQKHPELEVIKGLARAFALGLLRRYKLLDFISEQLLGIEIEKLKTWEKNLLRAIIYEARFRQISKNRILKASSKLSQIRISKRDLELIQSIEIKSLLRGLDNTRRLSIIYSQPEWVIRYFVNLLGLNEAITLLEKLNRKPTVWIRVNTLKISRKELIHFLKRRKIKVFEDENLQDVLRVQSSLNLSKIPEFEKGYFYIQDKASALVSHVLSPRCSEYVLDMCAAPGSKTLHVATLTRNKAHIVAVDWKPARLKALLQNLQIHGIYSVELISADSNKLNITRKFDKILLDPDCSSLGRLGQSPEIRLWLSENIVQKMKRQQKQLLIKGLEMLKEKGILVYSTCTLTIEENEELVKEILEENKYVQLVEQEPFIGLKGYLRLDEAQRLYPHLHDTLGFFIAKFQKMD